MRRGNGLRIKKEGRRVRIQDGLLIIGVVAK